tara:strand:+ start:8798 stop:8998 length:201 start_codon:yes stop_codon:yes gene_type:complete
MDLNPREQAQLEAEVTFEKFINYSKRGLVWILIFLCVVVFACNNGVETGPNATGSKYDGSVYEPTI